MEKTENTPGEVTPPQEQPRGRLNDLLVSADGKARSRTDKFEWPSPTSKCVKCEKIRPGVFEECKDDACDGKTVIKRGLAHTVTWTPIGFEAMTEITSRATVEGKTDYAKLALEALTACVIAVDGEPITGGFWGALRPAAGNAIVEIVVGSLQGLGEDGQGN